MKARWVLSAALSFFAVQNYAVAAETSQEWFDCGLLMGLQMGALVNTANVSAYGDVELMSHRWKVRSARLKMMSQMLEEASRGVSSKDLEMDLITIAKAAANYSGGYGDVQFWIEKNNQLGRLEQSTFRAVRNLANRVCK